MKSSPIFFSFALFLKLDIKFCISNIFEGFDMDKTGLFLIFI